MIYNANPLETPVKQDHSQLQTVEFRCPDGSADIYLLLAGLTVAARHGLEMKNALELAEKWYVDVNIFDDQHKERLAQLNQLPVSCWESANMLEKQAEVYQQYDVFPESVIKGVANQLRSFKDEKLREEVHCNKEKMQSLVDKYFHCG